MRDAIHVPQLIYRISNEYISMRHYVVVDRGDNILGVYYDKWEAREKAFAIFKTCPEYIVMNIDVWDNDKSCTSITVYNVDYQVGKWGISLHPEVYKRLRNGEETVQDVLDFKNECASVVRRLATYK